MSDERFELFMVVLVTAGIAGIIGFIAGRQSTPKVQVEYVVPPLVAPRTTGVEGVRFAVMLDEERIEL